MSLIVGYFVIFIVREIFNINVLVFLKLLSGFYIYIYINRRN